MARLTAIIFHAHYGDVTSAIELGSRVYLRNAVAGEPGVVVRIEGGKYFVEWPDLDMGRPTKHLLEALELDASYHANMALPELEEVAA